MTFPLSNQWTDLEELNATKMNARIDAMLNILAAQQAAFPLGSVGHNTLASPLSCTATPVGVATQAVNVVAGRKYRITGMADGVQVTSTGNPTFIQLMVAGTRVQYFYYASPVAGVPVSGSGEYFYQAVSNISVTFQVQVATSAGSVTIAAGAYVLVEDIGTT